MVGNPADARCFGILVQGLFGEAIPPPQGGKSCLSFLFLRPRNGTRYLPGGISSHPSQAFLPFGKHGIVEGSPSLQMPLDAFGLPGVHDQGQFQQHRGRFAPWLFFRLFTLWLLLAHSTAVYSLCFSNASSIPPPLRLERNSGLSPGWITRALRLGLRYVGNLARFL